MAAERRRVTYRGRVQGVGFRQTCCHIAKSHAVTGYVQNKSDGSVELVAEGDLPDIDGFLGYVRTDRRDFIRSEDVCCEPPAETQDLDFSIRY